MAESFHIQMTCPECGCELEVVNSATPTRTEHTSVWKCAGCHWVWAVHVDMLLVNTGGRTRPKKEEVLV